MKNQKKIGHKLFDWSILGFVLAGLILINVIASFIFARWDLTEDSRYSITESSKKFLSSDDNFSDRVLIKVYLDGDLPAELKRLRNTIEERLSELKQYAGKRIEYEFIDPSKGDESDVKTLQNDLYNKGKGITPTDITVEEINQTKNQILWPGAVITYQGETKGYVQFFSQRRINSKDDLSGLVQGAINDLEYNLVNGIRKATSGARPVVAFLQGQGEFSEPRTLVLRNLLKDNYRIVNITINDSIEALKDVDGLIIAGPTRPFSEKDKYVIDQFLMNGGRLMYFVDPIEVNEDTLFYTGKTQTTSRALNISDQLFRYGVRLNEDLVVDERCGPIYIPNHPRKFMPWYFFPLAEGTSHPISKNIDPVKLSYCSTLDFVGDDTLDKSVLLKSSPSSKALRMPVINYSMADLEPRFTENPDDPNNELNLSVLLEGKFESLYRNRLVDQFAKDPASKFKEESVKNSKILVVGDADLITNHYDSIFSNAEGKYIFRPIQFNEFQFDLMDPNVRQNKPPLFVYGTAGFLLNAIDYTMGDNSMIDIRAKTIKLRPLNKEKIKSEAHFWQFINTVIPLLIIIILGVILIVVRKRRYGK
ncbi:MAG: gliding motility-associated ABC transporter substrate-binding protein GldG [Crocinitomicaceae bacterium]